MNPPRNPLVGGLLAPPQTLPMASPGGQHGMPPQQQLPSQQQIDAEWERNPTDMTAEAIEQLVRRSGGALVAPWAREQPPPAAPGGAPRGLLSDDPPPAQLRSGPGTGGLLGTR